MSLSESERFVFPVGMSRESADQLLREAYAAIDEGKLLRRTNKLLRKRGIDPPMDVQYVAEPLVESYEDGLGISLGCDIMIYEPFPELEDCVAAFEEALNELLLQGVEKRVKVWRRQAGRA